MPVYLKRRIKDGWKAKENKRYGQCLVVMLCDSKTDKVLFEYAPNLVDLHFWQETFTDLQVYDELHKATMNIENKIHLSQTTKGWNEDCEK